ncbi:MAG TPA: Pr6Pr family membrane protein [Candidatus Saccharimonadales bacterium]|nr:Pr6Pr family membrane protein [Candidatus Saccharimonadales bacterium]
MKKLLLVFKVGFGGVVVAAVWVQLLEVPHTVFRITNFFSFFTIESNILGALTLLVSAGFLLAGKRPRWLGYVRGAATLYMVVTGIVYGLLLRNIDVQITHPWVNNVLHYIFPCVLLADWLADRPAALAFKKALWWLAFPFMYLAYSLVRGSIVHWYPYPFLNPQPHGYARVATASAVIALVGVALTLLLAKSTHLGTPKKRS